MKTLHYVLVLLFATTAIFTTQAQTTGLAENKQELSTEKVEVYYFHNTRRCATCQAVEEVTKNSLESLYPQQVESGEITFRSLNLEDDKNAALARSLNISGQTLLIVSNGKQKDLTNDAFLYARSNPEKLKEKIKKAIGTI